MAQWGEVGQSVKVDQCVEPGEHEVKPAEALRTERNAPAPLNLWVSLQAESVNGRHA